MSRRARCYLARAVWALLIVGALVGMNFVNMTADSSFLWSDKHSTLLSFVSAMTFAVVGVLAILGGALTLLNWLWDEAFGPKCR